MELWDFELMKQDRAFSNAVQFEGPEKTAEFLSQDARAIQSGIQELEGPDAILQAYVDLVRSGYALTFLPDRAEVANGGDLGYTVGRYHLSALAGQGERTEVEGRYVTIWRRQGDGVWRVEMMVGSPVSETTAASTAGPGG